MGVREGLEALVERVESEHRGLDELRSWQRRAEGRLRREDKHGLPEVSWESALANERREVRELLSASCSELTGHLNALREELLKQRDAADQQAKQLDGWCHSAAMSLSAGAGLESQIAELGGVLAARLQA